LPTSGRGYQAGGLLSPACRFALISLSDAPSTKGYSQPALIVQEGQRRFMPPPSALKIRQQLRFMLTDQRGKVVYLFLPDLFGKFKKSCRFQNTTSTFSASLEALKSFHGSITAGGRLQAEFLEVLFWDQHQPEQGFKV
jgi:hypothetical protein